MQTRVLDPIFWIAMVLNPRSYFGTLKNIEIKVCQINAALLSESVKIYPSLALFSSNLSKTTISTIISSRLKGKDWKVTNLSHVNIPRRKVSQASGRNSDLILS